MALTLPYPDLDFVPLDILTAEEMNSIVANYTFIAEQFPIRSGNIDWATLQQAIYPAFSGTNQQVEAIVMGDSVCLTGLITVNSSSITLSLKSTVPRPKRSTYFPVTSGRSSDSGVQAAAPVGVARLNTSGELSVSLTGSATYAFIAGAYSTN